MASRQSIMRWCCIQETEKSAMKTPKRSAGCKTFKSMAGNYVLAKYDRRVWAVYCKKTCTFSDIGKGRRYCERKVKELNKAIA